MENGVVHVKVCSCCSWVLGTAVVMLEQRYLATAFTKNILQRNHSHLNHTAIPQPNQHSEHVQDLSQDSPGKYDLVCKALPNPTILEQGAPGLRERQEAES